MATPVRATRLPAGRGVHRRARSAPDGSVQGVQASTRGHLDWDQIVASYNLTKGQLAETAGLAKDTLQKAARRDAAKTQARVGEMLEILHLIETWAGGPRQALAWYRSQPIPALDGRTAEALVKSGQAGLVRDYVDQIAVGGFA